MKRKLHTILILLYSTLSYSQESNLITQKPTIDTLTIKGKQEPYNNFWNDDANKLSFAPIILSGASAITWGNKQHIRDIRNRFIPTFENKFDDYIQYAPAAVAFGLKAAGIKGRNDLKRSVITYATSIAVMGILVNGIKYTANVERPDGSSKNSFPSGHTAMAFTNASFLSREYGLVNPAYSIGGYSVATMTAVGRGLNNRHWVPDVLAGAAVGIFSSQIAYFFVDKMYGNTGDNLSLLSHFERNDNPSFLAIKLGHARAFESLVENDNGESLAKVGWEAGVEGAYFLTKNWGIGGEITTTGFPIKNSRVIVRLNSNTPDYIRDAEIVTEAMGNLNFSIGAYYALHLSDHWNLMCKGLIGYSIAANGQLKLKSRSSKTEVMPEENTEVTLASYKPKNALQYTTGLALNYNIKSGMGVSLYSDYHHSKISYNYIRNKDFLDLGESETLIDKTPFNYITLGVRLTAYF